MCYDYTWIKKKKIRVIFNALKLIWLSKYEHSGVIIDIYLSHLNWKSKFSYLTFVVLKKKKKNSLFEFCIYNNSLLTPYNQGQILYGSRSPLNFMLFI